MPKTHLAIAAGRVLGWALRISRIYAFLCLPWALRLVYPTAVMSYLAVPISAPNPDQAADQISRALAAGAELFPIGDGRALLRFRDLQWAITPGQSAVFYDDDTVLGGGIIESASRSD